MQVVELVVVTTTSGLILLRAPFSGPVRLAIVASYTVSFEYGVISRSYGLGVLALVVTLLALGRDRPRWGWALAAAVVLAWTSLAGAVLASALAVAMLLGDRRARHRPAAPARRRDAGRRRFADGTLLAAVGAAITCIPPPSFRAFTPGLGNLATVSETGRHPDRRRRHRDLARPGPDPVPDRGVEHPAPRPAPRRELDRGRAVGRAGGPRVRRAPRRADRPLALGARIAGLLRVLPRRGAPRRNPATPRSPSCSSSPPCGSPSRPRPGPRPAGRAGPVAAADPASCPACSGTSSPRRSSRSSPSTRDQHPRRSPPTSRSPTRLGPTISRTGSSPARTSTRSASAGTSTGPPTRSPAAPGCGSSSTTTLEAARYNHVSARDAVCTAQRLAETQGQPAGVITERTVRGAGPAVRRVALVQHVALYQVDPAPRSPWCAPRAGPPTLGQARPRSG